MTQKTQKKETKKCHPQKEAPITVDSMMVNCKRGSNKRGGRRIRDARKGNAREGSRTRPCDALFWGAPVGWVNTK